MACLHRVQEGRHTGWEEQGEGLTGEGGDVPGEGGIGRDDVSTAILTVHCQLNLTPNRHIEILNEISALDVELGGD